MKDLHITHPNEQQTRDMLGLAEYQYLGYENGWQHVYFDENGQVTDDKTKRKTFGYLTKDFPEYGACRDAGHVKDGTVKQKQHNNRGSNCTYWCPEHKIFWKVDMSD